MITKRFRYNCACFGHSVLKLNLDKEVFNEIYKYIFKYPEQRFGQIICNYICPDYRNYEVSEETKYIISNLFPDNPDPFFEEPWETFKRLKS